MIQNNLEEEYCREIQQAKIAREIGNEGKARVCARRAVGKVAEEYLRKLNIKTTSNSVLLKLAYLDNLHHIPVEIKNTNSNLVIPVTLKHTHPLNSDLISEATKIKDELMQLLE